MTKTWYVFVVEEADETVESVESLQRSIPAIHGAFGNGPRPDGSFDPNLYLVYLKHLTLPSDYVLDYYYARESLGAEPILYTRHKNDAPLDPHPACLLDEYREAMFGTWKPFSAMSLLIPDFSDASWFELILFSKVASQFYLDWHALYNDFMFIASDR